MKKKEENNPVVILALLVILGGALVMIVRSLIVKNESPVVAIPAVSPTPAPAADAGIHWDAAPQTNARDPFYHPSVRQAALEVGKKGPSPLDLLKPNANAPQILPPGTAPGTNNTPAAAPTTTPNPAVKSGAKPTPTTTPAKNDTPPTPAPDPAANETMIARSFHCTAIFGGAIRRAVLEDGKSAPLTAAVGDKVQTLSVAAINEREIVLSGPHGFWTIPLQTVAADEMKSMPQPNKD